MVLKGQRKKRIQDAENESAGACMERAWGWNPFRNSMPGSRVGARVVSRVSTLLATMGKLGRLASLGGRSQTLSSGCGTSGIQWPYVEVLQPGAHHTWREKRKLQFCPLPSPAPLPEDELKPSGIPFLLNTPIRPSPPASCWMIRLSSSFFFLPCPPPWLSLQPNQTVTRVPKWIGNPSPCPSRVRLHP